MADSIDKYAAERAAIIEGMRRPEGITQAEIYAIMGDYSKSQVMRVMKRIRKAISPAVIYRFGAPKWDNVRHFMSGDDFEAWRAKMKKEAVSRKIARDKDRVPRNRPKQIPKPRALASAWKAPRMPKQPKAIKLQVCADADYSRAIITVYPSVRHDPRYQVGPGEMVPVVFRAIPLGGAL